MLVEPQRDTQLEFLRLDGRIGAEQSRAAGRASVQHIDERDRGLAKSGDERVRLARCVGTTKCELHVGPIEIGVGECGANRELALLQAGASVGSAERMNTDADYEYVAHDLADSCGRNA